MTIKTGPAIFALSLIMLAGQAVAAQPLTLLTDQTQLLAVSGNPGTVVVGNPSIADVTIQGQQVFLHGRGFGTTNIIIMDQAGNPLSDFEVTVMRGGSNDLSVFKAGSRLSYVCAPDCEATFHVGDAPAWFGLVTEEMKQKTNLATGKTASEAQQPAPTQ